MSDIKSVNEFLDAISDIHIEKERGIWVFRGHSDKDFDLKPSVGRDNGVFDTNKEYEKHLFEMFCREAHDYLSKTPKNILDWLSLAQHHGLPTRLLDFSYNPLVALYFASEQNFDKTAEVIAMEISDKASSDNDPFCITIPKKYYPNIISQRIRSQEGLFVISPEPEVDLKDQLSLDDTKRFSISEESKKKIKYELFRLGVHSSSLFPDINGLAARIKYQNGISPKFFE